MPIRFHCQRCHQLLGIASRKAGSDIQCPKCGISQIVPNEAAAAAALAMDQFAKAHAPAEAPGSVVVYEDEPSAIETPRPRREPKQTTPAAAVAVPSPPPTAAEPGRPVPRGMILFPRRTFYIQGLLFLIVAAVFFGSGYLMGLGDATYKKQQEAEQAEEELIPIQGTVHYKSAGGQPAPDEDAVVIALLENEFPDPKIPIQDIRPRAAPPAEDHRDLRAIGKLGGAYARVDAEGNFYMVVPKSGTYRVLIISSHADRPADADEIDLAEMAEYFTMPDQLVGRDDYFWSEHEVNIGSNPIEIEFPLPQ